MTSPTRRRHSHHDNTRIDYILDLDLFAPQLLNTEEGLQSALLALDRSWWQDELEPLEHTLRALIGGPHYLFVYVVAVALDEGRFNRLTDTLERTIPSTASGFVSSLASDLVHYFREFYIRLVCPDVPRSLDDCHRAVLLASNALRALKDLKVDIEVTLSTPHQDEMEGVKYKQPQRKKKHLKRQSCNILTTDSTPFSAIEEEIPRTREQVTNLTEKILKDQTMILLEYFRVLRLPALRTVIERLYIFSEVPTGPQHVDAEIHINPEIRIKESARSLHDTAVVSQVHPVDVHPGYPQIQPLKAAKYFSEPAEGFGHWNLLLSNRAIQHLKGFRRDENTTWAIIKKKMQELSNGFFSDSNQKRLKGSDQGIPIYEAKMTRDLRLIYQIDLAPDDDKGNDHQVVKVWGIYTHAQMDNRLWKSILYHQNKIGGEYRRRCIHRETAKRPGNNVILPASWDDVIEKLPTAGVSKDDKITMTTEEQLELHSILALEKFTRMSQALMNSIVSGQDDTYPFELTGAEQEIRDHPSSCFVLGRSGTGKTTTMVFKMIAREMLSIQQAAETDGPPIPKYRQLFVTQSRILAGRVQEYFAKMLMSQSAGQKTSQEIECLALRNQRTSEGDEMLDIEDEDEERSDLPKKFSDLEDSHFPLFLTVDQLSKLLESDLNLSFKRRPRTKEHHRAEQQSQSVEIEDLIELDDEDLAKDEDITNVSSSSDRLAEKSLIITFETFFYMYWPHFPQSLTKGIDPALVWNEFMGVIKGSEESLDTQERSNFLDKETYLNLSHRRQSTFAKHRERIYSIFECYIKLKRRRGDYDAADRTHAILRALNGAVPGGRKVDFLYVDEAQDNLLVDACLLRQLCGNARGLFWAGDTAQTISMGSSFRFDDLKAFLYRLEGQTSGRRGVVHPASFQLAINYRSHAGVVNCAHSVVQLISKFWPDSLDVLARERGVVDGPPPVFFSGWDAKESRYEQFLFHESGNIEFGAQQCILVRDEKAREGLRQEIGDVGLIMTLYESKGLEFNDVLLFNFFSDSTATLAEWRVILNAVQESQRDNVGVPKFDETRHSSLCSELKSLYVGITRARCHVWILDIPKGGEERGEPMRMFWESKGLVQTCRPGDTVPELAVRSTPEQWAQQGRALFKTKHFQLAIFCFERAGLLLERLISHAYLLRRTAQRISSLPGQGSQKNTAYLQAAEAFMICGGLSSTLVPRSKYLGLGADCFVAAGAYASAAQAYLSAKIFTKAAKFFKDARLFDEAADIILSNRSKVDPVLAEQCLNIARLHLHRERQPEKATRLFDSLDDQLLYLEEYGFDVARTTILQGLGRWSEAAEIHYAEGRPLDAISLWLRAGDPASRRCAATRLLNSLWRTLPLGAEPDDTQHFQIRLLELLRTLGGELLDETQRDESTMFLAIFAKNVTSLLELARKFCRGTKKNSVASLVCFDHALRVPPRMQNDKAETVAKYLEDYDAYGQLMHQVILDSHNALVGKLSSVARLLGFIETSDDSNAGALGEFHILPTSLLYMHIKDGDDSYETSEDNIMVTPQSLSKAIREVLGQRLRQRLLDEHGVCLRSKAFQPCLNFAVFGNCVRANCPREHLSPESLGEETFKLRTRIHLQQILIVDKMSMIWGDSDHRWIRRIWQERLYGTLQPVFYALGHISIMSIPPRHSSFLPTISSGHRVSSIPEHQRAMQVLSVWIYDRFYSLKPYRDGPYDRFLTDVVQTALLAFTLDRANAAHNFWRADCVTQYRPPHLLRKEGYILHDLLTFLQASSENSVASGVLFIKHVLDHNIPIDVNTLLHVVEAVVGRSIIAHNRSLHQITLPRSWIVNILSNWDERCRIRDITIIRLILDPLANLLEGIYSNRGVDHLIYERNSLADSLHIHTVRTVLIFRICKCLGLLGYNIHNPQLKHSILMTLTSLSRYPGRVFPHMIAQYIKADQWSDLARAVRSSTQSPLDVLILLCKTESITSTYQPPRGPRLFRFSSEDEVLPALEYVKTSKFNPEAKAFVPSALLQTPEPPADPEPFEDDSASDDSFTDVTEVVEVVAPNDLSVQRTEKEIQAAKYIQGWYRRKKTVMFQSNSESIRSNLHTISRIEVVKLQVSPLYRRMFLGPLPHILTALQGCFKALMDTKNDMKKHLNGSGSLDYDQVNDLLTKCISLLKTQKRIWKDLEPPSKLHHEGSVDKLRRSVEGAKDLVKDTLAITHAMETFLWDMEMGYKGIVRAALPPRPTAKTTKRPALNTEDIDEL